MSLIAIVPIVIVLCISIIYSLFKKEGFIIEPYNEQEDYDIGLYNNNNEEDNYSIKEV